MGSLFSIESIGFVEGLGVDFVLIFIRFVIFICLGFFVGEMGVFCLF